MASCLIVKSETYYPETKEYMGSFRKMYETRRGRNRAERHYRYLGCNTVTIDHLGGGWELMVEVPKGPYHVAKQRMIRGLRRR